MNEQDITAAVNHLSSCDPVMKKLIETHGPLPLRKTRNDFDTLAGIIVGQQLSGKAAQTIFARVKAAAGRGRLSAAKIAMLSDASLRKAGVSRPKIKALRSLAEFVSSRKLRIGRLAEMEDDEVAAEIMQVKGMGPWSAQMYLMFVLRRPDVFSENDLGLRKALVMHYRIRLTPQSIARITARWRPYRTMAALYLWRSLNNRP